MYTVSLNGHLPKSHCALQVFGMSSCLNTMGKPNTTVMLAKSISTEEKHPVAQKRGIQPSPGGALHNCCELRNRARRLSPRCQKEQSGYSPFSSLPASLGSWGWDNRRTFPLNLVQRQTFPGPSRFRTNGAALLVVTQQPGAGLKTQAGTPYSPILRTLPRKQAPLVAMRLTPE